MASLTLRYLARGWTKGGDYNGSRGTLVPIRTLTEPDERKFADPILHLRRSVETLADAWWL
jgi:hypothetical protein